MKSFYKIMFIVVLAAALIIIMAGCSDKITKPFTQEEGYVEATGIRLASSIIKLSPDGITSTYQLEPTILPSNATNKKIDFYIKPDDMQYLSVDASGKITAKKVTEENQSVTIKIFSTTNPDAFAQAVVVIEYVEVKSVNFSQKEMEVLFTSEPIQLELIFEPYHAQDGRDVSYLSQHPEVATVSNNGLLTINRVGITTIIATGNTLSGTKVEGHIQVTVAYADGEGKYRLDVTNKAPKFNQFVGEQAGISFSITVLDELCDPNPTIVWRVAGQIEQSQNGKMEYEYKPEKERTPSSYVITAEITPKFAKEPIRLESPLISLYKPFSNFSVINNEGTGQKYAFGEEIEFEPLMGGVDVFDWYIKEQGENGLGRFIGQTTKDSMQGVFRMNANFHGAYTVTVLGKVDSVAIDSKIFDFNIIKYMVGDRVQLVPKIESEEMTPDSFDWYLHSYDITNPTDIIENKISKPGIPLGTTQGLAALNYEGESDGWFIVSSKPTLRGLSVNERIGAESREMVRYSSPFKIWKKEGEATISYLNIDGAKVGKEYLPVIKWNPLGGVNGFVIEVVTQDRVYIIDTTQQNNDTRGIIFRDYSIILPSSMLTLEESFSVRVRQKSGVYCEKVNYEGNSIAKQEYQFLEEIALGINRYLQDMQEIGDLLNYITIFKPKALLLEKGAGELKYKTTIYTELDYENIDNNVYPVFKEKDEKNKKIKNIYNLVYSAINAYGIKGISDIMFEENNINEGIDVTITIIDNEEYTNQTSDTTKNYDLERNLANEPRGKRFDNFAIQPKDTIEVASSSQLYYVVTLGKRPLPVVGSIAEEIYSEAKNILNSILGENMTNFEKVLAIYDFLASEIEHDTVLKQYSKMKVSTDELERYAGYHLEGALLHRKAISQGTSKAFALLCWMEGIAAQRINGSFAQSPHSWNKVLIGDKSYNVDCSQARIQRENGAAISYGYFLVSDERIAELGYKTYGIGTVSDETYVTQDIINGKRNVATTEELESVLQSCATQIGENAYSFEIEFNKSFETALTFKNQLMETIQTTFSETLIDIKEILQITDRHFILVIERLV